jgi:hypothetical protein
MGEFDWMVGLSHKTTILTPAEHAAEEPDCPDCKVNREARRLSGQGGTHAYDPRFCDGFGCEHLDRTIGA